MGRLSGKQNPVSTHASNCHGWRNCCLDDPTRSRLHFGIYGSKCNNNVDPSNCSSEDLSSFYSYTYGKRELIGRWNRKRSVLYIRYLSREKTKQVEQFIANVIGSVFLSLIESCFNNKAHFSFKLQLGLVVLA